MVQGPRGATLQGIGALGLDALPVTRGTSYGCPFPPLFLATRIGLCGRVGLSTVGPSHTITREGLTSHGTSARVLTAAEFCACLMFIFLSNVGDEGKPATSALVRELFSTLDFKTPII
jgi:hypothetical protein